MDNSYNINYADNLYIINTKIREISDLLLLDADGDLFLSKTLDDIDFIDDISGKLLGYLLENSELVDRDEVVYTFYETETRFSRVLLSMEQGYACFSFEKYPHIAERIKKNEKNSIERKKKIEETMLISDKTNIESRVVSTSELSELLKGFEE